MSRNPICGPRPCQWTCKTEPISECDIIDTFDGNDAQWLIIAGSMTGLRTSAGYEAQTVKLAAAATQDVALNFELSGTNSVDISLETAGAGVRLHGGPPGATPHCLTLEILQGGTPVKSTLYLVTQPRHVLRMMTYPDGTMCAQVNHYAADGEDAKICTPHAATAGTRLVLKDVHGDTLLYDPLCYWNYGDGVYICSSDYTCTIGSWSYTVGQTECWWTVDAGTFTGGTLAANSQITAPMPTNRADGQAQLSTAGRLPTSDAGNRELIVRLFDVEARAYVTISPLVITAPLPPCRLELWQGGVMLEERLVFNHGRDIDADLILCVDGTHARAELVSQLGVPPIDRAITQPPPGEQPWLMRTGSQPSWSVNDVVAVVTGATEIQCPECPVPACDMCTPGTSPDPLVLDIPTPANDRCADCSNLGGRFDLPLDSTAGQACSWQHAQYVTLCTDQAQLTITAQILDTTVGIDTVRVLRVSVAVSIPFGGYPNNNWGATYQLTVGPPGTIVDCDSEYSLPLLSTFGDFCTAPATITWMPAGSRSAPAAMVRGRDGKLKPRVAKGKRPGG